ncbi:hypothetical protein TNCV_2739151 [Trichonephila clavipes]|nr:hypothetical protein TNCV_2739151 [Trichonephila clavipes]
MKEKEQLIDVSTDSILAPVHSHPMLTKSLIMAGHTDCAEVLGFLSGNDQRPGVVVLASWVEARIITNKKKSRALVRESGPGDPPPLCAPLRVRDITANNVSEGNSLPNIATTEVFGSVDFF